MKRVFAAFVVALCGLALILAPVVVRASGGGGAPKGSVVLKSVNSSSHGGTSGGQGQITPIGGYYVAPAIDCTVNISSIDLPDGTQVQITLEYLATTLSPVTVGTMTVSGKKAHFSNLSNPTLVSTSSGFNTMTIRLMNGTPVMSGSVRGL